MMVVVPGRADLELTKARGEVYPTPCKPIGGGGEGLRPCGSSRTLVSRRECVATTRTHSHEGNENIFHHDEDGLKKLLFQLCHWNPTPASRDIRIPKK